MTPRWSIVEGDCVEQMHAMPEASVDTVVCDPPYGLEFMGKDWDRFSGAVTDRDFKGFVLSQQRTRNVKCPDCGKWAYDHPGRLCECGGIRRAQGSAFQQWCEAWAIEALRVLKPGGHLLAFGGTRTYHRLACAIEDAGFEIRDTIAWMYGQGFPKSLNIGCKCEDSPVPYNHGESAPEHGLRDVREADVPATERASRGAGPLLHPSMPEPSAPPDGSVSAARSPGTTERFMEGRSDVLAQGGQLFSDQVRPSAEMGASHGEDGRLRHGAPLAHGAASRPSAGTSGSGASPRPRPAEQRADEPRTLAVEPGAQTRGTWPTCERCGQPTARLGTALKPAHEPIVVARKPLGGTVAANVQAHGTGALNVDGCRVESSEPILSHGGAGNVATYSEWDRQYEKGTGREYRDGDRWPANVVLDPEAAAMLDEQAPNTGGGGFCGGRTFDGDIYGAPAKAPPTRQTGRVDENGGASRFFYTPKASSAERNAGLDGFEERDTGLMEDDSYQWKRDGHGVERERRTRSRNTHPTVKPIDLMRWLVRLVTPPSGTILDPFAGSGTTGIAATLEGFRFVGIEREPEYAAIARARIAWWAMRGAGISTEAALRAGGYGDLMESLGQGDLFG